MIKRGWYRNGRPYSKIPYYQEQKHGISKYWYENGQIKQETPFHQGQRHGLQKRWDHNGQIRYEDYYLYNDIVTPEEYQKHELIVKLSGL